MSLPWTSKSTINKIRLNAVILSISFAEIACKIKKHKLSIPITPYDLYYKFNEIKNINIIGIGVIQWLDAIYLDWKDNKDPADRILVSYAIRNKLEMVTSDKKIKKYYKKVIW